MSRGGSKITKNSFDFARGERVSWLDELADRIDTASKTAVEVARHRNELSLRDEITSIISRKPTHATVADKVQDYHERTGLADYLKANRGEPDKVASLECSDQVFVAHPGICDKVKEFARNKVETSYGQTSIPHIQNEILAQFGSDGLQPQDVENKTVAKFISDLISDTIQKNPPANLSSIDLGRNVGLDLNDCEEDNNDFYKPLLPNTD